MATKTGGGLVLAWLLVFATDSGFVHGLKLPADGPNGHKRKTGLAAVNDLLGNVAQGFDHENMRMQKKKERQEAAERAIAEDPMRRVESQRQLHPPHEGTVVVAAVARNIEKKLTDFKSNASLVHQLWQLTSPFQDGAMAIFESGSKDGTPKALQAAFGDHEEVDVKSVADNKSENRTEAQHMAAAKNHLMQALEDIHYNNSRVDYVILIGDLDKTCRVNLDAIRKALERQDDWDALSFREPGMMDKAIEERLDALGEGEFLPVEAAPHTLSLYKAPKLMGLRFPVHAEDGLELQPDGSGDLRHTVFHQMMADKNRARVRVSPMHLCQKEQQATTF